MKKFVSLLCNILLARPVLSAVALAAVLFLSFLQTKKLTINSNQIDLLPPEFPEVIQTKKVVEMIGGNGFYIVAMKSKDSKGMTDHLYKSYELKKKGRLEEAKKEVELAEKTKQENKEYYNALEAELKKSADDLYDRLTVEPDIRYVSYRYNVSFMQDRLPQYLSPHDLKEVYGRIKKKIDFEKEKLNPFYMNLTGEEYNPEFNDIIGKYQRLAKRDIFDEYNISADKGMILVLVKPKGSFTNIENTRKLDARIKEIVAEMNFDKRGVFVGYTGTYKLNLDDYDSLVNALKPVSIASLLGIILLLVLFFRNPVFIIILTLSLISGILITFGLTGFFIGQLNTITSIMAAVLMGLGIDYGIQFLYRFREEYTVREDFLSSVKETIYHTGMASFISALTTTSAFVVLMFSEFRGFSEFGFIACYGIICIAVCMYFVTAIQIALLLKFVPSSKKIFMINVKRTEGSSIFERLFANPAKLLKISIIIIIILGIWSPFIKFNYSGRDLLLENQESLLLYDEIADRFEISSDPQVIVVNTLEESEAVYDFFNPVPKEMESIVDQVVSLWNLAPSKSQQIQNMQLLSKIKDEIKPIQPSMIKEEHQKHIPTAKKYLDVEEFSWEDVPKVFFNQFKEVPESKEKGYMLYVYPKIALWHGKDLIHFYKTVGHFEYPIISKRTLSSLLFAGKEDTEMENEEIKDYQHEKFTEEEERIILESANSLTKAELIKVGVLPETAGFITDHRPFHNINDLRKHKKKAGTVGSVILFARLALIVQSEAFSAIFITFGTVTLILLLFYRNILAALISLAPLLLGIVTMLGIMSLLNLKVNFMNILVFPIIIGYAIQNGIYIYFRYMEEKNIITALSKVGPAVIASTLTTLVGWSVLLIAEHRGLHSIGVAASIGIGVTLIVALTLLPALLEKFFAEKEDESLRGVGINFDTSLPKMEAVSESVYTEKLAEFQEKAEQLEITEPEKSETEEKKELIEKTELKKSDEITETAEESVSKKKTERKKRTETKKKSAVSKKKTETAVKKKGGRREKKSPQDK